MDATSEGLSHLLEAYGRYRFGVRAYNNFSPSRANRVGEARLSKNKSSELYYTTSLNCATKCATGSAKLMLEHPSSHKSSNLLPPTG